MGKITVKHYLEKRIKPEQKDDILYYPIYNQITINRKTTQFKSITEIKMSENEFVKYLSKQEYSCIFSFGKFSNKEFLEKEPQRIKKAFEFIINDLKESSNGLSFDKSGILTLQTYIEPIYLNLTSIALVELCWNYQSCQTGKQNIYLPFSRDYTLTNNIRKIRQTFDVDISEKIPKEDFIFWYNIDVLLSNLGKNSVFVDFVENYTNEIKKARGLKDKVNFINQISEIIKFAEYTN